MSKDDEFKRQLGPDYQKPRVQAWFEDRHRRDHARTQELGRPCYTSEVFYREVNPRDRTIEVCRLATEQDFREWPEEYAHYQRVHATRQKPRVDFLPEIGVGTVKEMNAVEVYTLEDLAANEFPEWEHWRALARKVLAALNGPEPEKPAPVSYDGAADFTMEISL